MCTNPKTIPLKSIGYWRYRLGYQLPQTVTVPCGKCAECLKKKQNDMSARIFSEAKKCSKVYFLTLTYAPKFEPWAVSLWTIDEDTGQYRRLTEPEPMFCEDVVRGLQEKSLDFKYHVEESVPRIFESVISNESGTFNGFYTFDRQPLVRFPVYKQSKLNEGNDLVFPVRSQILPKKLPYRQPRSVYHRSKWCDERKLQILLPKNGSQLNKHGVVDNDHSLEGRFTGPGVLLARYTPTFYLRDVKNAMKLWRIQYERAKGKKLPDFKYVCVGEMGTKFTQRPHIHMLLMSDELTDDLVKLFLTYWPYGRVDMKCVSRLNEDKTDAFALLARYLGKYINKGNYASVPIKDGLTIRMKTCCSHHLGQVLSQEQIDYFTCQDIKKFDQEHALTVLSDEEKKVIIPEVARRLVFTLQYNQNKDRGKWEVSFRMPLAMQKQIFNYRIVRQSKWAISKCFNYYAKTDRVALFSELYYMVKDFIRDQADKDNDRKYSEFCASWYGDPFATAVAFENFQKEDLRVREAIAQKHLSSFYAKQKC